MRLPAAIASLTAAGASRGAVALPSGWMRAVCPAVSAVQAGRGEWDYQGVGFHAFRKACGSLLFAHGKTLKQVQGWLRHSQLTTTMNVYINQVDDGLGAADVWDDILPSWGNSGATQQPEAGKNGTPAEGVEVAS